MIDHYANETCYYYPSNIAFANRYNYGFTWLFDDNTTATGYRVSHIWTTPGKHVTTLMVTDMNNNLVATTTITQNIGIMYLTPTEHKGAYLSQYYVVDGYVIVYG